MRLLTVIFILFSVHNSISAQTEYNEKTINDSMKAVFDNNMYNWMNAYNGGDAKNLIPFYSEDAEYISSHVKGLVAKGRDRLIENFQYGINMGGHIDKVEILSINYSCDLATLVCKYEATNNGENAVGRNLIVLKKVNNSWLIITHMTVV